ncbi:DUF3363 domain-containing protein [Bordetella tumulicola]|uniref:DUF3363 domain-containing protein n=1 Tax=Bordetella tumulicola TaxID=1649133 RepID=UPI0039EE5C95
MAIRDEDRFQPRPAPPKGGGKDGGQRFVSQVLRQVSRTGPARAGTTARRGGSAFWRGRVAARFAAAQPSPRSRRVIIKSRFVLVKAGGEGIGRHLRYLQRDGVTREGEPGRAYGADTDDADTRGFEIRSQGDRHQFRFIVSAEDAEELGGLRDFTRALMRKMSIDLETRLDWVAVDHWDTDNPHTHIVLRGRDDNGKDLVIAPDYLGHGMRARGSEIVTEWLGPRTEREIQQSLVREVGQERFTTLDRTLLRHAVAGMVDLAAIRVDSGDQSILRGRLRHLSDLGLANPLDPTRWQLDERMEETLRSLGERGDIIRTLHRAMRGEAREWVIHEPGRNEAPIVGRVAGKGLADELHDTGYLVIDAVDGRAHYVRLPSMTELADYPLGGIVAAQSAPASAADRNIAAVARDGIYRTSDHLTQVRTRDSDPDRVVKSHVRRLEALRRAGMVERIDDGVWRIPQDLTQQGQVFDIKRTGGLTIELRCHLPLVRQVQAMGATWLDTQLIAGGKELSSSAFGAKVREAMWHRADFLVREELAERRGQRLTLARNLLQTLRDRELAQTAATIMTETGLSYKPVGEHGRAHGVYKRSLQLVSGRYALLNDGLGFSLVPWRPVVEQRLGQSISATIQAGRVTWEFGRKLGPSIG